MMDSTHDWNLPDVCRNCNFRDDDYCNKYNRTIWIALRMVGGCDLANEAVA
jgi:hypothetical protein